MTRSRSNLSLLFVSLALGACASQTSNADRVEAMAERAVAACGHGQVAEVSVNGFRCKADSGN